MKPKYKGSTMMRRTLVQNSVTDMNFIIHYQFLRLRCVFEV